MRPALSFLFAQAIFLPLFLNSHTLFAQKAVATIELASANVDDIQGFETGDSLFFTFTGEIEGKTDRIKQACWIHAEKRGEFFDLNVLNGQLLLGITQDAAQVYYYSMASEQSFVSVNVTTQNKLSGAIALPTKIFVDDSFISTRVTKNTLELFTYNKGLNTIVQTRISGVKKSQTTFKIPIDISKEVESFSGILSEDPLPSIAQGTKKLKAWLNSDSLILTIDRPYNNKDSKTILARINVATGQVAMNEVPGPPGTRFTSVYHQGNLFRLIVDPKFFKIEAYGGPAIKLISSFEIGKTSDPNAKVYEVDLDARKTLYSSLRTLVRFGAFNSTHASILVEPTASGSSRLIIGTYYDANGRGIIGAPPNPFIMLSGFLITHAISKLEQHSGVYRYSYLDVDETGAIKGLSKVTEERHSARQKIDEYEAQHNTNVKNAVDKFYLYLLFRSYFPVKGGAVAIYHEKKKKSNRLVLLKFED